VTIARTNLGHGASTGTGINSVTYTTTATITVGSTVVVLIGILQDAASAPSVSSVSIGTNTLAKASGFSENGIDVEIWWKDNCSLANSGSTVTVNTSTLSGSDSVITVNAETVTGLNTGGSKDKTNGSASLPLTTGTLSSASEIIYAVSTTADLATVTSPFSLIYQDTSGTGVSVSTYGYDIVSATTSVSWNPTTSSPYAACLATFQAALPLAVIKPLTLVQEQPNHPLPAAYQGVQGPNVGGPERRIGITVQETPDHPKPIVFAGTPPVSILPPIWRAVIRGQEQPNHPIPIVFAGQPTIISAERRIVVTTQEIPLLHPSPFSRSGVSPALALVPPWSTVIRGQEQPGHPLPITVRSIQGPNVGGPECRVVITAQELPLLHPVSKLASGGLLTVLSSERRTVVVTQEVPLLHPVPSVLSGVYTPPPIYANPITTLALVQELPLKHPLPSFIVSPTYSLLPAVQRTAMVIPQEIPLLHPRPTAFGGVPPYLPPPPPPPIVSAKTTLNYARNKWTPWTNR
jgi:hypothetical protein